MFILIGLQLVLAFAGAQPTSALTQFLNRQALRPAEDFIETWQTLSDKTLLGETLSANPTVVIFERANSEPQSYSLGTALARTEDKTGIRVQRFSDNKIFIYPARDISFATKKLTRGFYIYENQKVELQETYIHPHSKKPMWLIVAPDQPERLVYQPEMVEMVTTDIRHAREPEETNQLELVKFLEDMQKNGSKYPEVFRTRHLEITKGIRVYNRPRTSVPVMVVDRVENKHIPLFPGLFVGTNKNETIAFVVRTDRATINLSEVLAYPKSEVSFLDEDPFVQPGDYIILLNKIFVEAKVVGTFTHPVDPRLRYTLVEAQLYNESSSPQQRLVIRGLKDFKIKPELNSVLLNRVMTTINWNDTQTKLVIGREVVEKVYNGFVVDGHDGNGRVWPLYKGISKDAFSDFAFISEISNILKIAFFDGTDLVEKDVADVSSGGLIVTQDNMIFERSEVYVVEKEGIYRDSFGNSLTHDELLKKVIPTRAEKWNKGFDACRVGLTRLADAWSKRSGEEVDDFKMPQRSFKNSNDFDNQIGKNWDHNRKNPQPSFLERFGGFGKSK